MTVIFTLVQNRKVLFSDAVSMISQQTTHRKQKNLFKLFRDTKAKILNYYSFFMTRAPLTISHDGV